MPLPKRASQLIWFIGLWAGGVSAVLIVGLVIRLVLMPPA